MKWKTRITEMIGCKYPILLGGFVGYDNKELTAAISKAGGCGILTASFFKSEEFRNALLEIKKITSNPFGLNFTEYARVTPSHQFYKFLEVAHEEGVNTIITSAIRGNEFGKKAQEYGMNWFSKVITMKHAVKGVELGADGIVLTGLEGGGGKHPKMAPLFTNMVNASRYIGDKPFIASGGISDGKGMLAALIAGAQAVHLCTAFLATSESPISQEWKQRIIDADCFDPEFLNTVCHFKSGERKSAPISLAAGTVDKLISAEELVKNIVSEAETRLNNLGFQGDEISFI